MHRSLMCCLFFAAALGADETGIPYLTSECETLSLVDGIVNAHNGQVVQIHHDIEMRSVDPIAITRYYDGGHHHDSIFGYGVGLSLPTLLVLDLSNTKHQVAVEQRTGSDLLFKVERRRTPQGWYYEGVIAPQFYRMGYTNSDTLLRGSPSAALMSVGGGDSQFKVAVGDGSCRYYDYFTTDEAARRHYRLVIEELPDGNRRIYSYLDGEGALLKRVETVNSDKTLTLNWVEFDYKGCEVAITASNGQSVQYTLAAKKGRASNNKWSKKYTVNYDNCILADVTSSHQPHLKYSFSTREIFNSSIFGIKEVQQPQGRSVKVSYNEAQRVQNLYAAGHGKPLYTFRYYVDHNSVIDALGERKQYRYYKKMLRELLEGHRIHFFNWSKKGELEEHTVFSPLRTLISKREYSYDAKGNIAGTVITGAITEKGAQDSYAIEYSHSEDNRNLLVRECHPGGLEYSYSYLPNSCLLTHKSTALKGETIEREFYSYDKNGILVRKVVDDGSSACCDKLEGVTYRLVTEITPQLDPRQPGMTLPKRLVEAFIDPATGERRQLKMSEYSYTQGDLLAEEKVYDSEGVYRYSRRYDYDGRRRCVREVNALGEELLYSYDANNRKIFEEKAGSGKKKRYTYDLSNNLIEELEEHADGEKLKSSYAYDAMGNKIEVVDCYGGKTRYNYDPQGRLVSTIDPMGRIEKRSYDKLGHANTLIDKDGYATTTVNNIYGSPLEVSYPDGSKKRYSYNLQGILVKELHPDGTYTSYKVDHKGRPEVTARHSADGSLLAAIRKQYKGNNLVAEVDAMGNETRYSYDGAGRCIRKESSGETVLYSYDSLGNLRESRHGDFLEIKEHDLLGRVVEERKENLYGHILSKTAFAYDSNGNIVSKKVYSSPVDYTETTTLYNSRNLPIVVSTPQKGTSRISYKVSDHLDKESIDLLGRRTVESYDSSSLLQRRQLFDNEGELIAYQTFTYDGRGNMVSRQEERLFGKEHLGSYTVAMKYDAMGQKIAQLEQGARKTHYRYSFGRLEQITLPDGVALNYRYDPLGRLEELKASDGSVHYCYSHDLNGNILTAEDRKLNLTTIRRYDSGNRLTYERQMTGFEFEYSYDSCGRLEKMEFADGTLVYTHTPTTLASVDRYRDGKLLYSYYQEADWAGKIVSATLPNGVRCSYSWDPGGQCVEINSAHYQQVFNYDLLGNLITTTIEDAEGSVIATYRYDSANRLISENGPFVNNYSYDSLNNCCVKNENTLAIDQFNQLLDDGKNLYRYDLNGRRITQNGSLYKYDALGRLISYSNGEEVIAYRYDPFGRRIERSDGVATTQFLYQMGNEIGAWEEGKLVQFGAIHDACSPFAIELGGELFSPIRNHRGDICMLLDKKSKPMVTYRYNAFGCAASLGIKASPWLFSGHRYDEATKLYHCEKREYDPAAARWLTPDPRGFVEGINLYAYVKNNPFIDVSIYEASSELFFGLEGSMRDEMDCLLLSSKIGHGALQFKSQWLRDSSRFK